MTGGADWGFSMLFHALSQGSRQDFFLLLTQLRHIRRRRGRGSTKNVLEDPFAAFYRRGPCRVGRQGQDARVSQKATTATIREAHFLKLLPSDSGDPVMTGQPLVHKSVVRLQKIEQTSVLTHDVGKEDLGLLAHGFAQLFIEGRISLLGGSDIG